jgi:hypothetical protein
MSDILLNYVLNITENIPTPAADTSFLKRAVVVCKPITGVANGFYTITNRQQFQDYTANTSVYSLFDGGLNIVYLVTIGDLANLGNMLADKLDDFYTILISEDYTTAELDTLDVGAFEGVVGYTFNDEALAKEYVTTEKRVGFYGLAENGSKNMMFAFGSLLSVNTWTNQQYIQCPVSDGIVDIGTCELYFADRVSFVLTSKQYGNRLAFFSAGKKAITEPYLKREIEIKLQSSALNYIALNKPTYTPKQATLLGAYLYDRVINQYIINNLLEWGEITITLDPTGNYEATGVIRIPEPKALWRILATLTEEN